MKGAGAKGMGMKGMGMKGKGMGAKPPVKAAPKPVKPMGKYADGGKVHKTTKMPTTSKGSSAKQITDTSKKRSGMINAFMDEVNAADRAYGDKKRR